MSNISDYEKFIAKSKLIDPYAVSRFDFSIDSDKDRITLNKINFDESNVINIPSFVTDINHDLFSGVAKSLRVIWKNCQVKDLKYLFLDYEGKELEIDFGDCSNVEDISYFCYNCCNLEKIIFNVRFFNVLNTSYMFSGCVNLSKVIGLSIRSKPLFMSNMFLRCKQLTNIDLSDIDMTDVRALDGICKHCTRLKEITFGGRHLRNCIDYGDMFYNCYSMEELDLDSIFNMYGYTNSENIFKSMNSLRVLKLGGWFSDSSVSIDLTSCANLKHLILRRDTILDKLRLANNGNGVKIYCLGRSGHIGKAIVYRHVPQRYTVVDGNEIRGYFIPTKDEQFAPVSKNIFDLYFSKYDFYFEELGNADCNEFVGVDEANKLCETYLAHILGKLDYVEDINFAFVD